MRQLRTILRLRLQAKLNLRQIKTSLRLSLVAVQKICSKAETLDLDWPAIEELELHAKAFLIEMYFHNRCICQHVRQYHSGTTTVPAHMPGRHKKHHHGHQGD